eukprot:CAMPEP_0119307854 /NCGR_PEP_ID=MMETSP1333-20130426/8235_1 /TAXON_ID=418940 /ORGANISM="Scyphosphaera apsteinii, Strain RCC1455" /LENGTH=61 /DNA_ID=CAMNT_0007311491 /DNA_START=561 /DNA_END=743 /DNA_ORIENTATION=+
MIQQLKTIHEIIRFLYMVSMCSLPGNTTRSAAEYSGQTEMARTKGKLQIIPRGGRDVQIHM